MPAEKKLLISTVAAEIMNNDGTEFYIEVDADSGVRWRVIPQRNLLQLCNHGSADQNRQLEPRLMQLLCLLAKANGNVLSREVLMDALWPRVVVNENSLTRAVSELRKALALPTDGVSSPGKSGTASHLIETVPKRGYCLNARLMPAAGMQPIAAAQHQPAAAIKTADSIAHRSVMRYPAIAAAMVISAALSSLWTIKLAGIQEADQMLATQAEPAAVAEPQVLEDRVVGDATMLPEGLHWLESVHNETDGLQNLQPSQVSASVLAPGGQMMAYIEDFPGQSQLRLRSLAAPDEAWTVFTSSSPITHLQWSPLDAGLLFTVHDKDSVATSAMQKTSPDGTSSSAHLSRLMLLDLETLQIRELYRRVVPASDEQLRTVGSLT